jgi:hypothetical protein
MQKITQNKELLAAIAVQDSLAQDASANCRRKMNEIITQEFPDLTKYAINFYTWEITEKEN